MGGLLPNIALEFVLVKLIDDLVYNVMMVMMMYVINHPYDVTGLQLWIEYGIEYGTTKLTGKFSSKLFKDFIGNSRDEELVILMEMTGQVKVSLIVQCSIHNSKLVLYCSECWHHIIGLHNKLCTYKFIFCYDSHVNWYIKNT